MAEIVTMPKLGFDMAEGVLVRWAVSEGGSVEKGDLLAEIETDKATVEVEAPYAGVVLKHIVGEDSIVPVNDPIAVIGEAGEEVDLDALVAAGAAGPESAAEDGPAPESEAGQPKAPAKAPADTNGQLPDGIRASPVARRMAQEANISLSRLTGTGPKGRIVKKDVQAYLESAGREAAQPVLAPAPAYAAPEADDMTVPLTKLRQAIGRRMTESKQYYPHFYVTYEYNLDNLMDLRQQANAAMSDSGVKLSVNDFIVKAVALTLRDYPNLNASLGEGELHVHGHRNIGVAVAVEGGLLTVVCRDADFKTLSQISSEIKEMAGRVRSGKVHPDDIQGSTFTTSNLGMYGVDDFTAIINPPEACILAISAAKQAPVVSDGELAVAWRMKATISADHRITDGAEAADFMRALATYLEEPIRLMV